MASNTAYVAPDSDDRGHFNSVRTNADYRISLRLGNIEDLFTHDVTKPEGKLERLQVLGLFYFPLKHERAMERYEKCWEWFKEKLAKVKDDPAAEKVLLDALKSRVVSGAKPPRWNDPPTGLPVDAQDPMNPAPENFAKIRIPGGYSFQEAPDSESLNLDCSYRGKFDTDLMYGFESAFYDENKALGKIPLVATVETRSKKDDPWKPAVGAWVYFQLVPAYPEDQPAFDPAVKSSEQFARPPLAEISGDPFSTPLPNPPPSPLPPRYPLKDKPGGPQKMVDAMEAKEPTEKPPITGADRFKPENALKVDPQGRNAHKDFGGKRGAPGLLDGGDVKELFLTEGMDGFNDKVKPNTHKPYTQATKATPDGAKHLHAVKAETNEDGEAGVIFSPSRCGGDRYRIRAYVGPPTLPSSGAEVGATQATTGTFIVWRNLRISRLIRHEVSPTPDSTLLSEASAKPFGLSTIQYLQRANLVDRSKNVFVGLDTVRLDDPDSAGGLFASLPLHFAPAFLEVEFDGPVPEILSDDEWKAARRQAVDDAKAGQAGNPQLDKLRLDVLYHTDSEFAANKTVCTLTMRSPIAYNELVPPASRLDTVSYGTVRLIQKDAIESLTLNYALHGFMRALTRNGALPGLTLVYSAAYCSWHLLLDSNYLRGASVNYRGAYLWCGVPTWAALWTTEDPEQVQYDCTSAACHELGHVLFQTHGAAGSGNTARPERHDPESESACLMSYGPSNGNYCGMTLLAFRGWKVPHSQA